MKISPRYKKWIRRILILLLIRLAISGVLYYVIVYRFKELVQIAVHNESKGLYSFDASHIDFSLFKRRLLINDAQVFCTDTSHTPEHLDVTIPKIALAIQSWRALIFHQRVLVDSLLIERPVVNEHEHYNLRHKYSRAGIEPNEVISMLKSMTRHLQIKKLKVVNGSYSYRNRLTEKPFIISHVNFYLRNFSKKNFTSQHFFSSEEIDLNIGAQHWELPDGRHDVTFKRLHFSGRSQFFKIDSCIYHDKGINNTGEIFLRAERLLFNSRSLAVNYTGSKFIVDTLICQNVSLGIHAPKPDQLGKPAAAGQVGPAGKQANSGQVSPAGKQANSGQVSPAGKQANSGQLSPAGRQANSGQVSPAGRQASLVQLLHLGKSENAGQLPQLAKAGGEALRFPRSKPSVLSEVQVPAGTRPPKEFQAKKQGFDVAMIRLFKNIQFRYIDIKGGQVRFRATDNSLEFSKHLNFKVYNLFVPADSGMRLGIDSIRPKIVSLKFYR